MKRWAWRLLLGAAALALVGFLISASGLVSIKASSRHWAVTRWVLEFSMRRSVATHSLGIKPPKNLDDPALILKGAGPYAVSCSACHGSPGTPHPRVAAQMTPHPPNLAETAPTWEPHELFTIVKHGVKFTGMPAWPAPARDDEVWAVVAFVRQLPRLEAAAYQEMAYGQRQDRAAGGSAPAEQLIAPTAPRPAALSTCVRCHGEDGNGRGQPAFPRLAGQQREYLLGALNAFAEGRRSSGIMEPVAYGLDPDSRRELADYYAQLPSAPAKPATTDAAAIARGRELAHQGDLQQRIASCVDCHGPAEQPRRPEYPTIAGQPADYLALQLELFQRGVRGGSDRAHLMDHIAPRLSDEQRRAVAAYYESLDPGDAAAAPP